MILEDVRGIPEFWLTAMKNVDHIADMIQVHKYWVCGALIYIYREGISKKVNISTGQVIMR